MGPTRRLDVKDLEAVPVDSQTCRTLVEQSSAHLRSAQMLQGHRPASGARCGGVSRGVGGTR